MQAPIGNTVEVNSLAFIFPCDSACKVEGLITQYNPDRNTYRQFIGAYSLMSIGDLCRSRGSVGGPAVHTGEGAGGHPLEVPVGG